MGTTNPQQQQQPPKRKKPFENNGGNYFSLGFQVIAIVVVLFLAGWKLDKVFHYDFLFKLIFGALGVIASMYIMVKELMNDNK